MEYIVWTACPNDDGSGFEDWYPSRFGYKDQAVAHKVANGLRNTYPGHYFAVTKGYRKPLPIKG